MGAFPSHSLTSTLSENFQNLDKNALVWILNNAGYMTKEGKPTKKSATEGLVDSCESKALWNLELLNLKLTELGNSYERKAVNQNVSRNSSGEPQWVNLGTVGSYFSVSATAVGKWLDELDLRDDEGMANAESLDKGLANTVEMNAGKNKTRKITQWNLELIQELLMEAGHYLDFDYEKSLKGSGRNSDVRVESVEDRVKEFAREFTKMFKDTSVRRNLPQLVRRTPKPIQKKAEELMKKPGFITEGKYLRYLDRE